MTLKEQFLSLTKPFDKSTNLLHVQTASGYPFAKVGINASGQPTLLIDSSKRVAALKRNYRLKYIEFNHQASCTITDGEKVVSAVYLLIIFRSLDQRLNEYFFGIAETFLETIALAKSDEELEEAFRDLIEIFRSLNDAPLSTVQGLWAELFVIEQSKSPQTLLSFWHDSPKNKFDFEAGLDKLELKSSRSQSRVHMFAAEQLNADSTFNILVGSIFVIENSKGKCIMELLREIEGKFLNPSLLFKLKMIVARTLGTGLDNSATICFDSKLAKDSLAFYDRNEIDKIERQDIPLRLSEVHFKSDLSFIRPINPTKLNVESSLFSAL